MDLTLKFRELCGTESREPPPSEFTLNSHEILKSLCLSRVKRGDLEAIGKRIDKIPTLGSNSCSSEHRDIVKDNLLRFWQSEKRPGRSFRFNFRPERAELDDLNNTLLQKRDSFFEKTKERNIPYNPGIEELERLEESFEHEVKTLELKYEESVCENIEETFEKLEAIAEYNQVLAFELTRQQEQTGLIVEEVVQANENVNNAGLQLVKTRETSSATRFYMILWLAFASTSLLVFDFIW